MVSKSPKFSYFPSKWLKWLINEGYCTNHLLSGMILQASPSAKALACIAISVVSQLKGAEKFLEFCWGLLESKLPGSLGGPFFWCVCIWKYIGVFDTYTKKNMYIYKNTWSAN